VSRGAAFIVALTGLAGFLVGLVVAGTRPEAGTGPVTAVEHARADGSLTIVQPSPGPATPSPPTGIDFAAVAARLNRSVVNVETATRGSRQPRRSRRYSTDDSGAPREGSGSGFVIDPAGFILTNHHVVAGVDRVTVTVTDGRALKAAVVGADPTLDVALLKVESDTPLPAAPLGDSRTLRVGEWVCAIGNPLGVYVHSVTVGVVSYIGRKLFDQSLDAYIQTDAAISVGNSGGPLLNGRGEVVGITTAVSAEEPSIGFAVPISEVVAILPQLKAEGSVARGDIGARLRPVTAELRRALGLGPDAGALVEDVQENGPGARSGLRAYDVVTGIDGRSVQNDDELVRYVASLPPGRTVRLAVWRDGSTSQLPVKLGVRPVALSARRMSASGDALPAARDQAPLGFGVRDFDQELADRLGLPAGMRGVLVTEVDPAGPAQLTDLRTNHVVTEINRAPVRSVAEYGRLVTMVRPGDPVALLVYDRATRQYRLCTVVSDSMP
jgi:serine protease Do